MTRAIYNLPACSACQCQARDHIANKHPDIIAEPDGRTARQTFVLGACSTCDCAHYTFTVTKPRVCTKIEGI